MGNSQKQIPARIVAALGIYAFLHLITALFLPEGTVAGWIAGYILGLLAVIMHYLFSLFTRKVDDAHFAPVFLAGLLLRFLIVLSLFLVLILTEKFDQFSFTVGFLISYIFHSVNDVILLNKKLTNLSG
ncbi:hypothetical protein [Rhodohalobacter mucosus]|uniref:ATP synthase I chain n=1 Tax=Rhodohalobacter mucosus TaxID=2079485 RepID=A0A316TR16_9BACT|nr:hypothetical protein [Rhodohalobacter mucosus]PWN06248.1 hypothetical protein DDZ15_10490 [Rhodohalobacter mucosus]